MAAGTKARGQARGDARGPWLSEDKPHGVDRCQPAASEAPGGDRGTTRQLVPIWGRLPCLSTWVCVAGALKSEISLGRHHGSQRHRGLRWEVGARGFAVSPRGVPPRLPATPPSTVPVVLKVGGSLPVPPPMRFTITTVVRRLVDRAGNQS